MSGLKLDELIKKLGNRFRELTLHVRSQEWTAVGIPDGSGATAKEWKPKKILRGGVTPEEALEKLTKALENKSMAHTMTELDNLISKEQEAFYNEMGIEQKINWLKTEYIRLHKEGYIPTLEILIEDLEEKWNDLKESQAREADPQT